MAKYRIAWLPGDGIGVDVLDATRIVLEKLSLDAQYIPGDIGWEFWRREGDALPPRTIELLTNVDAALARSGRSQPKLREKSCRRLFATMAILPLAGGSDAPNLRPVHLLETMQGISGEFFKFQGRA